MSSKAKLSLEELRSKFEKAGQGHLFTFSDQGKLDKTQTDQLIDDLNLIEENTGVENLSDMLKLALETEKSASGPVTLSPFRDIVDSAKLSKEILNDYYNKGLLAISQGKIAVCLMAGGQGTRLGSSAPKGCYDIGNLSHKSIFQYQAEKLLTLQNIAAKHANIDSKKVHIQFYIMTSVVTYTETVAFFKSHNYFGLSPESVHFFNQAELPALSLDGKIILEGYGKVNLGPNGNGGIYEALARSGSLNDMEKKGITHLHVIGVDNVLVKLADPTFMGFVLESGADCVNKVVLKTDPKEKVGVMSLRNGVPAVVEYSEIPENLSIARDENGALLYSGGNIANHCFSVEFLHKIARSTLPFHIARKALMTVDVQSGVISKPKEPNAIKLEMFVFDVFHLAKRVLAFAVPRNSEFSPVKNAAAIGVIDSPATALNDLTQYHIRQVKEAGGIVHVTEPLTIKDSPFPPANTLFEISPLISYDGEGLEALVKGKEFKTPFHLH